MMQEPAAAAPAHAAAHHVRVCVMYFAGFASSALGAAEGEEEEIIRYVAAELSF